MKKQTTLSAILAAGFGVLPALAAEAVITEFATPSANSLPEGVDVDRYGNIWYAETSAGKIAVLWTNHATSEFPVPAGGQPVIVKAAADGIWFTDGPGHAIGRLDPATGNIQEWAIPSGSSPLFLQLGPDGSKWFSKTTGVGRLSPRGTITEWNVTLEHPDDNIEQISLDRAGQLWFVERNFDGAGASGTNKVRRLDPGNNVVSTYLVPTLGGNPAGVLANADGTVWVSEYFANAVALLFPNVAPHTQEVVPPGVAGAARTQSASAPAIGASSGVQTPVSPGIHRVKPNFTPGWVEFPIPTANAQAEDMRTDRLGRLWFEEDSGLLAVLNPATATFTEYAIPSANSGYFNIALDQAEGLLWFTEAGIFAPVPTKIGNLRVSN